MSGKAGNGEKELGIKVRKTAQNSKNNSKQ